MMIFVFHIEGPHAAVANGIPRGSFDRLAGDTRAQRANGAAVAHDEDALLWTLIEQSLNKELRARDHIAKRLTIRCTRVGVHHDALLDPRDRGREFAERMSFEDAKAAFT